jgi:galactose-1-phosphate uridylyltransferase
MKALSETTVKTGAQDEDDMFTTELRGCMVPTPSKALD